MIKKYQTSQVFKICEVFRTFGMKTCEAFTSKISGLYGL